MNDLFGLKLIVAADGSGNFTTLRAALESLPAQPSCATIIKIKAGIYREKIKIDRPRITLIGADAATTIITWDDHAKRLLPDGQPMNTFNSYTLYIGAPDFTARNLTFENSAGDGREVGQALAAYVDADRAAFRNCRFLGHQDTLFTGPLPKNPTPKGLNLIHPVLGLAEAEYTGPVRQYYEDCYIEGDVDFIFGSATAFFNRCQIHSRNRGEVVNGYITAASTGPWQEHGYLFKDCRLAGAAGPASVYLGRPWRPHARVAFIACEMGAHIHPAGWHNWELPERETTVTYEEFGSFGPGANDKTRVKWAKILTPEEAERYTPEKILAGPDNWRP
jgi:pectinesterase